MMTRVVLTAGLAMLLLGAAIDQGRAQTQELAPSPDAAAAAAIQPSAGPRPSIDGHELIGALQACAQLQEQARRDRCEMQARRTDGMEVKLSRGPNESVYGFKNYP